MRAVDGPRQRNEDEELRLLVEVGLFLSIGWGESRDLVMQTLDVEVNENVIHKRIDET